MAAVRTPCHRYWVWSFHHMWYSLWYPSSRAKRVSGKRSGHSGQVRSMTVRPHLRYTLARCFPGRRRQCMSCQSSLCAYRRSCVLHHFQCRCADQFDRVSLPASLPCQPLETRRSRGRWSWEKRASRSIWSLLWRPRAIACWWSTQGRPQAVREIF